MAKKQTQCWMTYCGLHVDVGITFSCDGGIYHMGRSYDEEHNMLLCSCPYSQFGPCVFRESIFDGTAIGKPFSRRCVCEPVDISYDYDQSIEKALKEDENRGYEKKVSFMERYPLFKSCNRLMIEQDGSLVFDRFAYDRSHCTDCTKPVCGFTRKRRDLTKVHVCGDYDFTMNTGTLLERKVKRVGVRFSNGPLTTDSASRLLISLQIMDEHSFYYRYSRGKPDRLYLQKYAARRDLAADIAAASEGIEVIHDKVFRERDMNSKRQRRQKRQKAKKSVSQATIRYWEDVFLNVESSPEHRLEAQNNLDSVGIDTETLLENSTLEQAEL